MMKLRTSLDENGLKSKEIGYTTRFNAFWTSLDRPSGFDEFASDGEGITINEYLKKHNKSLNDIVDWVNIMAYDIPNSQLPNNGWTIETYNDVFNAFAKHIDKNKIVMGFEPGGQAAGGEWQGMENTQKVINKVHENDFGGIMFWAINEPGFGSTEPTGKNSQELAKYGKELFESK